MITTRDELAKAFGQVEAQRVPVVKMECGAKQFESLVSLAIGDFTQEQMKRRFDGHLDKFVMWGCEIVLDKTIENEDSYILYGMVNSKIAPVTRSY